MGTLSDHCIPFILDRFKLHQDQAKSSSAAKAPPFFLGINGIQGAGKTTLVSALVLTLSSSPHNLKVIAFSIDDIYLRRADQVILSTAHRQNRLVQHRGQPGTHDVSLGLTVFQSLREGRPTLIPRYDKSAFQGKGDRVDSSAWTEVNTAGGAAVDIVIFEGWCVGFRPLPLEVLAFKWDRARHDKNPTSRLWRYDLEEVAFVNEALNEYDGLTDQLAALIHLDAEKLEYVYEWRLEQEMALRATKGSGMSDTEVIEFVDGYYPAYELYTDDLRRGAVRRGGLEAVRGAQLRLVIDKERGLMAVERI